MQASNQRSALPSERNVRELGQIFTPESVVKFMMSLRQRQGRVLEPACGNGAFLQALTEYVAIEIDPVHAPAESLRMDFFAYPQAMKFVTVIGNPPYVRFRDIPLATRRLFDSEFLNGQANLYLYFIEKAVRHLTSDGELIFITPREFLKATAAVRLNAWLYEQGTITHAIELGDTRIFKDATPNCLIWRFEKGRFDRRTQFAQLDTGADLAQAFPDLVWQERTLSESAGQLLFCTGSPGLLLIDIATVKVGAVSGANEVFVSREHGNREFVYSQTCKSGQTRSMIWTEPGMLPPSCLLPHKARLMQRDIRPFDETNWWQWGRGYPLSDAPRIYVNALTRHSQPFFIHPARHFDGSVLAVFPHDRQIDLAEFRDALNSADWYAAGFICDGRFRFSQRSLQNAPLPETFRKYAVTGK